MNGFFNSIMSWLRGIKSSVTSRFIPGYTKTYVFGQIISGRYRNYKHDPNPTIFCMGTYISPKTGRSYVHGFNMHYLNASDLQWLASLIINMRNGGMILDPRQFYYYIKLNRPSMTRTAYRIYHTGLCDYKTICPGVTNAGVDSCYSVTDGRDTFVKQLNSMLNASNNVDVGKIEPPTYNRDDLQRNIQNVLNTRKIW